MVIRVSDGEEDNNFKDHDNRLDYESSTEKDMDGRDILNDKRKKQQEEMEEGEIEKRKYNPIKKSYPGKDGNCKGRRRN